MRREGANSKRVVEDAKALNAFDRATGQSVPCDLTDGLQLLPRD
jgi:hypothetical protein